MSTKNEECVVVIMTTFYKYIRMSDDLVTNQCEIPEKFLQLPPEYVYNGRVPADDDLADYIKQPQRSEVIA